MVNSRNPVIVSNTNISKTSTIINIPYPHRERELMNKTVDNHNKKRKKI